MKLKIDKFYEDARNAIFYYPEKQWFHMEGPVGTGKTTQFTIPTWHNYVSHITPRRIGSRYVRNSKSAIIRFSRSEAETSIREGLESFFGLDGYEQCVKIKGNDVRVVHVKYKLPDGTYLDAKIDCIGFSTYRQDSKLRSVNYHVMMLVEVQKLLPDAIIGALARAGRRDPDNTEVKKTIDGKEYRLSGADKLCVVISDGNIEARPHYLYDMIYDNPNLEQSPYMLLRPPQPIFPVPFSKVKESWKGKGFPETVYEGQKVMWLPNKAAYNFTRHYEEKDAKGNNIKYSGYKYWFKLVYSDDDDRIRRDVEGKESKRLVSSSVYRNYDKLVHEKEISFDGWHKTIYIGWDPGLNASWTFLLPYRSGRFEELRVHCFQNMFFSEGSGMRTEEMFKDFVLEYCEETLTKCNIKIIPDPYAWTGHHNNKESSVETLERVIDNLEGSSNNYTIERCKVVNQNVDARIDYTKYFIDKHLITFDPSLRKMIAGMSGGYKFKTNSTGQISNKIDKFSEYSHIVESLQYGIVNIYLEHVNPKRKTKRKFTVKTS